MAIVMLALGVKLLFDKDAEFTMHSCKFDGDKNADQNGACSICDVKDLTDCTENSDTLKLL